MPGITPVARIYTPYSGKFGIPRQPGLVQNESRVVFEKPFRDPNAVRGLESFSHLWLIWGFSENEGAPFSPTVRPPRLGGNERVGVFASRASYRPNALALSAVRLLRIDMDCPDAPVLVVEGADMLTGSPVYDIKPYLPRTDSIPGAVGGYADRVFGENAEVAFACDTSTLPEKLLAELTEVLRQDPRVSYQNDPGRVYAFEYGGFHVEFTGEGKRLTVTALEKQHAGTDRKGERTMSEEQRLKLVEPDETYLDAAWAYRQDFLDAGDSMDGCGPIRRCQTPEEWLSRVRSFLDPSTVPEGLVQATQFLGVRESDGVVVGMIQVRHRFNDYLEKYAGHIGYSVRPSERRKGYAKEMLALVLPFCRDTLGLRRVLITCVKGNEGSRRTILSNGGVYECTVYCPEHDEYLERYWIEL